MSSCSGERTSWCMLARCRELCRILTGAVALSTSVKAVWLVQDTEQADHLPSGCSHHQLSAGMLHT